MPQGKNLELIGCLFDLKVILFICLVSEVTLKLLSLLSFFFQIINRKDNLSFILGKQGLMHMH